MNINKNLISQNGNYISYKSESYTSMILHINEMLDAFIKYLESLGFICDKNSAVAKKAQGNRRAGCLTIYL